MEFLTEGNFIRLANPGVVSERLLSPHNSSCRAGRRRSLLEEALKNSAALAVASVLCLAGGTLQAQPQACGGAYVCTDDSSQPLAVPRDRPPATPKLARAATRWSCADGHAYVAAETRDEAEFACAAIGSAIQLLGRCGIAVRRPLHLEIRSEVRHPLHKAEIFGFFDAKRDVVLVTRLAGMPDLIKGTPFANLPVLDVYRSVIVHEVVHALLHQNLRRPVQSNAANEYPAYALQIESLPPHLRNIFLQSFNKADIEDRSVLFNDLLLFIDPFHFAARAHHHFKTSPNGCAHISSILDGAASFVLMLPDGF